MIKHIILKCPHCKEYVLIYENEFNCKIFRHAYYKDNFKQIDPHTKKEECTRLFEEDKIYGWKYKTDLKQAILNTFEDYSLQKNNRNI